MPRSLLAATEAPTPLPQMRMPRSADLETTASPIAAAKSGIIGSFGMERAKVDHLKASLHHRGFQVSLEVESRVIRSQGDFHVRSTLQSCEVVPGVDSLRRWRGYCPLPPTSSSEGQAADRLDKAPSGMHCPSDQMKPKA